jgi:heat shock protein HslJ
VGALDKRRGGSCRRGAASLRDGWLPVLAAVAVLAVASCAAPGSAVPAPSGSQPGPLDPVALVGMWRLTGAGTDAGTVVGVTPGGLTIYKDCGKLMATWRADGQGLFVGSVTSSTDACDPETPVRWLNGAAAYRKDGRDVVLLDVDGGTVARLVASSDAPRPDRESFEVAEEVRSSFGPAATLPPRVMAARREELTGRWVPVPGKWDTPEPPHLELRADGRWSGWDGCNGSGGGWVLGPAGTVLATTGISTFVGCDGAPVGTWLSSARLAGFDGATLVLLDQDAKELGRLRRDGGPMTTPPSGS